MPPDARMEVPPARPMKAAPEPPAQPAPEPPREAGKHRLPASSRVPAIIVGVVIAAVAGLSIWYLVRPQPLLVQGEVDATRFDIAAPVDARVGEIPVERGQNVAAGAVLVKIDNPETIAKHEQAQAAKIVAEAQLANINAGTRAEVIATRKAALERAQASVVLAQKTYDRVSQLAEHGNAPIARLDQATDSLHESQRAVDQAKSAHEQAVNGYTKEEHEIAEANVGKAIADIKAAQSIIDQMVIYAPVASQVYRRNVEPGEYVSPGVPLVTLINLDDMWVHFDLRRAAVRRGGPHRGVQSSGHPRAGGGRRRRGPIGHLACLRGSGGDVSESQHRRTHRRPRLGGACDPGRGCDCRRLRSGQFRARPQSRAAPAGRRLL